VSLPSPQSRKRLTGPSAHGLAYSQGAIDIPSFPLNESMTPCPSDPYALSKALVEQQCSSFARIYPEMRIVSLRCTELSLLKELPAREEEEDARWLWSWVNPVAASRAFLLALTAGDWVGVSSFSAFSTGRGADAFRVVL
jgi:hypothetical protein